MHTNTSSPRTRRPGPGGYRGRGPGGGGSAGPKRYGGGGSRGGGSFSRNNNRRGGSRAKYIDPKKFVNKAAPIEEVEAYDSGHSFADFQFVKQLHDNLEHKGYETPTAIQDQAIKSVMEGSDIVGLANTGTGKTAAFVLPIINKLALRRLESDQRTPAIVIVPTRELAHQVDDEFRSFSFGMKLFSVVVVGGEPMGRQIQQLRRGVDIIVGTPGRLKDLEEKGVLRLQDVDTLVLDEADQMLDMGFINDIKFLIGRTKTDRQMLCFSATMTRAVENLLEGLLTDPVTVSVRTSETSEHIEQDIIRANGKEDKIRLLEDILRKREFERVLVFGETKFGVQRLADTLTKSGLKAEAIHGNKSQAQRRRALEAFKKNNVQILCATDVAARGLDIPDVSVVINFDQPNDYETYIHRIGRTGRAGKAGLALTFV